MLNCKCKGICIVFCYAKQRRIRHIPTSAHSCKVSSLKQRSLALLSQEVICQKAIRGHILTPALHSKCLKERPDEASVSAAGTLLPLCVGVSLAAITIFSIIFIYSQSHALWLHIMSDSRHSGVYFSKCLASVCA